MDLKIALCLSGEPRSTMFCYPYIYENLIQKYSTDVYIHSWRPFRALDLYNPVKSSIEPEEEFLALEYFKSFPYPNKIKEFKNEVHEYSKSSNLFLNCFKMLLSIEKCFKLIENPSKYDAIIRCRLDVMFRYPGWFDNLLKNIVENKNDIIVPWGGLDPYQYGDTFAIGNSKSMGLYSQMMTNLPTIAESLEIWHGEHILGKTLEFHKLKVDANLSIPIQIVRHSNIITDGSPSFKTNKFKFYNE